MMCYWLFQVPSCQGTRHMAVPRHELTGTIVHRNLDTAYPWDQPISPYNHRNNATWVLIWGDVHPNLGQRRIYRLNNHTRTLRGPLVPPQDIEAYTKHRVTNTQRDLQCLKQTTQHKDTNLKLATWNVQGAQGRLSLQCWANILYLVSDRRIDLCGIQEYDPGFAFPEAATGTLHNEYKCYAALGTGPQVSFLAKNTLDPHMLQVTYSPWGLAAALRLQPPVRPGHTIVRISLGLHHKIRQKWTSSSTP